MKTLYLVRHAKSSWDHPGLSDFDRPLMPKGITKSKKIIDFLVDRNIRPDLMVSSPAVRAFETAKLFAKGLGYAPDKIKVDKKIYDGYYDRILDVIFETGNEAQSLMMFGHNPTLSHLANLFIHPGIEPLTTSAVAAILFNTDRWEDIPAAQSEKVFVVYPKMLP